MKFLSKETDLGKTPYGTEAPLTLSTDYGSFWSSPPPHTVAPAHIVLLTILLAEVGAHSVHELRDGEVLPDNVP